MIIVIYHFRTINLVVKHLLNRNVKGATDTSSDEERQANIKLISCTCIIYRILITNYIYFFGKFIKRLVLCGPLFNNASTRVYIALKHISLLLVLCNI